MKYELADSINGPFAVFATRAEAEAELERIVEARRGVEARGLMDIVGSDSWQPYPQDSDYDLLSAINRDPTNYALALQQAERRIRGFHAITEIPDG